MYNTYVHDTYRRIISVIDESAEILDKKRFPKAQHARIDNIIGYLSIIACTGRAFGVHLILGTQRPDAAVVPGRLRITSLLSAAAEQKTFYLRLFWMMLAPAS